MSRMEVEVRGAERVRVGQAEEGRLGRSGSRSGCAVWQARWKPKTNMKIDELTK